MTKKEAFYWLTKVMIPGKPYKIDENQKKVIESIWIEVHKTGNCFLFQDGQIIKL